MECRFDDFEVLVAGRLGGRVEDDNAIFRRLIASSDILSSSRSFGLIVRFLLAERLESKSAGLKGAMRY